MNGPFSDYAWGDAYESMHETMYRMKNRDPSPRSVSDDQLAAMWDRAYEAYQTSSRVIETVNTLLAGLNKRLAEAQEADDQAAAADLLQRLSDLEMTAADVASTEARIQRDVEWLETIDAEYQRRPWLCGGGAAADNWAINEDAEGWSEARTR